jgi:hypothetical protein
MSRMDYTDARMLALDGLERLSDEEAQDVLRTKGASGGNNCS